MHVKFKIKYNYTVNNKGYFKIVLLVTLKCNLKISSIKELLFMMHKIL